MIKMYESYQNNYLEKMWDVLKNIEITDSNDKTYSFEEGVNRVVSEYNRLKKTGNKIIFIGNGGSAGIASHQSADYTKNGKLPAITFFDPSLLTCISNDYGYEYVYEKPIEIYAKQEDILIAISSSGQSENILNAVNAAKKKGLFVITLSGFKEDNPLREKGDMNFYIKSECYGHVEIIHLIISHIFLDTYMKTDI